MSSARLAIAGGPGHLAGLGADAFRTELEASMVCGARSASRVKGRRAPVTAPSPMP